jgi:hypothetical protein
VPFSFGLNTQCAEICWGRKFAIIGF